MKNLTALLFALKTPKQIEELLDEMFEAYIPESNLEHSEIANVHIAKRTIVEIVNKLYNNK